MIKIKGDALEFSSGRSMYANNGIIGLSPGLQVFEGYDGEAYIKGSGYTQMFDQADALELADHMIERWQAFKERHNG